MNGIVINPQNISLYSDHLAPLASILKMPYIVKDWEHACKVKKYYPDVTVLNSDEHIQSPDDLFEEYDCFIQPLFFNKKEFDAKQSTLYKSIRSIYCPHGYSDKPPIGTAEAHFDENLIYGDSMLDLYRYYETPEYLNNYTVVGNYRYEYYLKHRKFYDDIVGNEVFGQFPRKQSTILYAPTWKDIEDSSSFFGACDVILDGLPDTYNIVVKLHPNLFRDNKIQVRKIMEKYGCIDNVVILEEYMLVYPVLAGADIYIGDVSSIGYDFLIFDRPMFFLNKDAVDPSASRKYYLYRCGTKVCPKQYRDIFTIIDNVLKCDKDVFSSVRKNVYEYTFSKSGTLSNV